MGKPGPALTTLIMLLTIVLIPPLVFILVGLFSDMSFSSVLAALLEQYTQRKRNLLLIGLFACLPLLLIGLEFVIGPLFFAPVAMFVCMLVAWLAARKSSL